MSRRVAPSALRTPISRVRLVTETIMIAITPMPPTSSATLDSTIITRKNTPVILLNVSRIWSCVIRSKVFGSAGRSLRISRSATVTASCASATVTPGRGFTAMNSAFVLSIVNCWSSSAERDDGADFLPRRREDVLGRRIEADHPRRPSRRRAPACPAG